MKFDTEQETKILRYHYVVQLGVNTIASQLRMHHSTGDPVISQASDLMHSTSDSAR